VAARRSKRQHTHDKTSQFGTIGRQTDRSTTRLKARAEPSSAARSDAEEFKETRLNQPNTT